MTEQSKKSAEELAQSIFDTTGEMLAAAMPGAERWGERMVVLMELERLLALNIKEAFADSLMED